MCACVYTLICKQEVWGMIEGKSLDLKPSRSSAASKHSDGLLPQPIVSSFYVYFRPKSSMHLYTCRSRVRVQSTQKYQLCGLNCVNRAFCGLVPQGYARTVAPRFPKCPELVHVGFHIRNGSSGFGRCLIFGHLDP